jgi:2',3'-cyclic-nucleotide 2'-phosphodiesterase (5'-nucleotidase family)
MLVQINNPVAVSPTNSFGEIWVLADNGANATGRTARGGSQISPSDFNPERIQIDDTLVAGGGTSPLVDVGARLGTIVGVVDYSFNNFEVLPTTVPTVVTPSTLQREVTTLAPTTNQLTVATFNVENLDPGDGATKFNSLAARIVSNLKSPDILSIEEIQDNNGPTNDSVVDASVTYQTLITAIAAAGGPTYQYRQIDPVDDTNGGEPGGNIRVGFLFNSSRVSFVDRSGGTSTSSTTVTDVGNDGTPDLSASPGLIDPTNAAFASSRKPLVGEFLFNGQTVYVIGNHFNSKGGDQPLFGPTQPPALSSETQRNQQATIVADFAKSILAINPKANIVVAGDLNDFEFSNPLSILKAAGLTPLTETLPANERYTYNFQGNAQTLDHLLVSNNLLTKLDGIDVVHINSEFADQDSDHDPSVARFNIAAPFQLQILHASDFEAGIPAVDDAVRFSAVLNRLRTDPSLPSNVLANTLTLSSGDNYIPGAFLNASSDISLNGVGGLGSSTAPVIGRGDIGILNSFGIQASALGNHEFDLGVRQVRDILRTGSGNPGTNFPYLSTNLNFQPEIAPANPNGNLAASDLAANQTTAEASTIKGKIAKSTVITLPGNDGIAGNADDQKIGIVGATTPTLPSLTSIGGITVSPSNPIDYDALAADIQSTVDILKAQGINKIILLSHMQQFNIERDELAPRLRDVDIIIGGGSNTLLSDSNDVLRTSDTSQGNYPVVKTAVDGKPVLVVNTDGNYKYVGRLVTEFDDAGILNVDKLNSSINGAYATDEAGVDRVYGADVDPRAVANPNVVAITDGIENVIATKDNLIVGKSSVFLNGTRQDVRTQETNFGNVTADANLFLAKQIDPTVTISLKNGGGIRDNIGSISAAPGAVNSDDIVKLPTQPNPLAPNKQTGDISQLDIENSLRFNNDLSLITLTAQQLEWVIEHAVAGTRPGSTPGQFPQVSGLRFSFDPTKTAIAFSSATGEVTTEGDRIRNLAVLNDDGSIRDIIVKDGVLVGDPNRTFRIVTLNFLAGTSNTNILGGDNYPFPKFVKDNAALANRVDLRGETIDLNGNGIVDPALALAPGKFTFAAAGSEQDAFAEYLGDRFSTTPYSVADVEPQLDMRIQRLDVRQDTVLTEVIVPPVVDNNPVLIPVGTPGDDNLFASQGALFDGQNDILFTGAGNDTVDFVTVAALPNRGNNRLNSGSGNDTIYVNKNDRLFGGAGADIFDATDSQGGNRMSGGAGDDIFFLGKGDRALGGDGNDKFYVQTGGDNLLSGGAGNDQFWIVNAEVPSGSNTILDFQIGTDVIGIFGAASLGISTTTLKLNQVGTDTAVLFGGQTLATLSGIQATDLSLNNPNQFVFA